MNLNKMKICIIHRILNRLLLKLLGNCKRKKNHINTVIFFSYFILLNKYKNQNYFHKIIQVKWNFLIKFHNNNKHKKFNNLMKNINNPMIKQIQILD